MFKKIIKWFKNYWYYYKTIVIIVLAFVIIIGFCLFQSLKQPKYDVQILYCGPYFGDEKTQETIENGFKRIVSDCDYNGDGKNVVDFILMTAFTDEQIEKELDGSEDVSLRLKYAPYTVENVENSFSQQAFAGDCIICLLDDFWYGRMKTNSGLVKLSSLPVFENDKDLVALSDDGYSIKISDIKAFNSLEAFSGLPEDTRLCFRTMPTAAAFTGKKQAEQNYTASQKFLFDLLSY